MPHFHPAASPRFLSEKMRDAERAVWEAFQKLDFSWHVFYSARENSGSGWDREIDFVLIRLNCIFYCEVKGGVVIVDQRAGPGVTWAHLTRSGETIKKRADPKQLWQAKAALGATISRIAGRSPRDLRFREHDFYIFPHTPKEVTRGVDLERGNVHYAFAEDIDGLPARLQGIVESGKGRFIDRARIDGIISALDAMVIKDAAGALCGPMLTSPSVMHANDRLPLLRSVGAVDRASRPFKWLVDRRPLKWNVAAVLLLVLGLLHGSAGLISSPLASKVTGPVVTRAHAPATRSVVVVPGAELPAFIAASSADEVERAIAVAYDQKVYVSWRSETQRGLVLLLKSEVNGCRQYQVSRHDVQPAVYGFVRRCP